ncbi:MAG: mannosyltransferase [Paludibacter sp.]|nr:mannosyltransferase [Paludibacter sp.]
MIPKKLHYCWFGSNPKSELFQDCISSWKKQCPDFQIIEWNETNAEQYSNSFYKNALRKKKYAFAADYIRTSVLFEQGGIYLDTDMLLLKPINDLLDYNFFIGDEVLERVNFAFFGAKKEHPFLKEMLDFYSATEFNVFSPPIITHTFSPTINQQTIDKSEIIFSPEYFYPLPYENRAEDYSAYTTVNSYAVHLWDHSWKNTPKQGLSVLVKNWLGVIVDFVFYGYSYSYFKRYFKEFSRKIYQELKAKINK